MLVSSLACASLIHGFGGEEQSTGSTEQTQSILLQTPVLAAPGSADLNYPRIANLWGLTSNPDFFYQINGYDLAIPYSYKNKPLTVLNDVARDANTKILFTQYSTKGRPDLDSLINEWWNSPMGTPGYACLFRDSSGSILLSEGWNQPRVNMINQFCRDAILDKNVNAYLSAVNPQNNQYLYDGIYWDVFYGRISWLGDDIDSDLDGKADDPAQLDSLYMASVLEFLKQLRSRLPDIILVGNEAPIEFSQYMNGRVYEWQLQSYLDNAKLQTWKEIIEEYTRWANLDGDRNYTILMNAPEEALIEKYGYNNLDKIPAALMQETSESYQRMRFGLTSALMGNGLYAFDFGKMIHGQYWWYDEYGRMTGGSRANAATLPSPGYLGSPLEEPFQMASSAVTREKMVDPGASDETVMIRLKDSNSVTDVWARRFENGIALVNTGTGSAEITLTAEYCKLNGQQAPLYSLRVDDNEAIASGDWMVENASFDQFGSTIHVAVPGTNPEITYTPWLAFEGEYEVFVWSSPSVDQSKQVTYIVNGASGKYSVVLDETSGEVGWKSLGVFSFHEGKIGYVKLGSSADGNVVADALKWVSVARYNDGSRVNLVELQPNDGIILVDCGVNP